MMRPYTLILLTCFSLSGCFDDDHNNGTSIPIAVKLNDTGISACADDAVNNLSCNVVSHPGQDGDFGRDVNVNDDSNGAKGFVFTKINSSGARLAATETQWDCVTDDLTGLTWEVKTTSGIRSHTHTFSWFQTLSADNSALMGQYNSGICTGSGATSCDTQAYVERINNLALCGYRDWRLPSREELRSIVEYRANSPTIDANYFPNAAHPNPANSEFNWYWSSNHYAGNLNFAWQVSFDHGGDGKEYKYAAKLVRLVRGG